MDAKIKINELPAAQSVAASHLIVVQDSTVENAETKKATLGLLRSWLQSLTFKDLAQKLVAGENISINIDSGLETIEINSTLDSSRWFAGEQPTTAVQGDLWLSSSGNVYRYNNYTWESTQLNLTGPAGQNGKDGADGKDGFNPVITITPTENGYNVSFVDAIQEQELAITNGLTPHIDEESKHWFIGQLDTGVLAKGVSPTAKVEMTDVGFVITVNDENETSVEIETPTVQVGSVAMLPFGQPPTVINTGDNIHAVLDFALPKGADGGGSITRQGPYVLSASDWTEDRFQYLEVLLEVNNRNVIDIDYNDLKYWGAYQVRPETEDEQGILFKTSVIPPVDLTFYITSMGVLS